MPDPHTDYIFYGTEAYASEVESFLEHVCQSNLRAEAAGRPKTPVCIWGFHGIGKTELARAFAQRKGYGWAYIAPAQFEEMGDLLGMPRIVDGNTSFAPPEWVPRKQGPGILLIDDVNRADDRILRGIMQLLQNHSLAGWALPEGWQIVLTANPDGGDYSVTPMDDAMITRMMHVTMRFDVKEWARWAERHGVDPRGINFVLTYPEIVNVGDRTTARSLTQFFRSIEDIENLESQLGIVRMLADACLDKEVVTAFIAFVRDKLGRLPSPQRIMDSVDFEKKVKTVLWEMVNQSTLRVDLLATLCTRMVNYLVVNDLRPSPSQAANIKAFMLLDFIPNDLRLGMAQDLMQANDDLKMLLADPELSLLLLENM